MHEDEVWYDYYSWTERQWNPNGVGTYKGGGGMGPPGGTCGVRTDPEDPIVPCLVSPVWPGEFCEWGDGRVVWKGSTSSFWVQTVRRQAGTRYELHTNGKQVSGQKNLFVLTASGVQGRGNLFYPEMDTDPATYAIAPTTVQLGDLGKLGSDGRLYTAQSGGVPRDVTPTVPGSRYYTYTAPGQKEYKLNLTAYRPTTEGPAYGTPFQKRAVPDELEENPGAGIRVNGDDDNINSSPDRVDNVVANENDLIEVTLDIQPAPPPTGLPCVLKRANGTIRAWTAQNKGEALVGANAEADLLINQATMTFWIENPAGGAADLKICAKESNAASAPLDTIHFYPFTSVVIALGGETQVPADPPLEPANHGTFRLAIELYEQGYDVHMYDEDNVDDEGAGAVYGEVERAVQRRNVSQVAIFGYSHGGGSTHDLAERLNDNRATLGTFTIPFAAYIDAVENDSNVDMDQELRRPPSSAYHVNYYQVGVWSGVFGNSPPWGDNLLDGGPINPPGAEIEVNLDQQGQTVTHGTIDDQPLVLDGIR